MSDHILPPAPPRIVDDEGRALYGTYVGAPELANWEALRDPTPSALYRKLRRKRWLYAAFMTPDFMLTTAVVDVGYAANAFVFAVDLGAGETLLQKSWLGLPGLSAKVSSQPGAGASASFRGPGVRIAIARPGAGDPYSVEVAAGRLEVSARIAGPAALGDGGSEALTYVGTVGGNGRGNCTMKVAASRAEGFARIGERRFELGGALGGLDFTDGLLARETRWRWAFVQGRTGDGRPIGINLVEGFNARAPGAPGEDALWQDGRPTALAPARFDYDRQSWEAPWKISTEDGAVALEMKPVRGYCERHELGFARSRFLQIAARFSGRVRTPLGDVELVEAPGVAEDQEVKW